MTVLSPWCYILEYIISCQTRCFLLIFSLLRVECLECGLNRWIAGNMVISNVDKIAQVILEHGNHGQFWKSFNENMGVRNPKSLMSLMKNTTWTLNHRLLLLFYQELRLSLILASIQTLKITNIRYHQRQRFWVPVHIWEPVFKTQTGGKCFYTSRPNSFLCLLLESNTILP